MRIRILHSQRMFLSVLFALMLCVTGMTKAFAQVFTVGDLNYSINDDEISVTVTGHVDGSNASGNLVIPGNVSYAGNTYVVTAIGDNAFNGHSGLTGSLVIPNSVIEVGYAAFSGCSGFNGTLTLGNSLTTIGSHAFEGCSGFTGNLVIPNSVTILGGQHANWGWDWSESYAFSGCSGFNGTLTLSNSLSAIGCGCFMGCSGFTGNLVIPNSVGQLGCSWGDCIDGVFEGCSGFTGDLTILGEIEIGPNTFSGCSGFSGMLTLGAFVIGIYDNAFSGCEGFNSITALGTGGWLEGDAESIFAGVDKQIPVYVSCDIIESFQENPVWSSFSNLQATDPCLWEILAVADPPEGGTVSGSGLYVYGEGGNGNYFVNVDLCAIPNEGYTFYYWTDDFEWNEWDSLSSCNNGSIWCNYTYHRHYIAHFRPASNEITVMANPVEGGTVSGGGVYGFGAECTLTAMANEGYLFVDWTENGRHVSYDADYSFIVTEDRNLVANFREGDGCAVIFDFYDEYGDGWNGNKLVVTDDYGYSYQLTLEEGFQGTQVLMLVDGSHITLTWIKNYWAFECSFTVSYSNGDVICQVTEPNNNFNFEFDLDCSGMPVATFDVTAIANPVEGGTVSGGGEYEFREECTLTATANEGYLFVNWTENGNIVSYDASYSFIVTEDRSLVANFVEGDVCAITFDLYDMYGDGWNGNKLVVTDEDGISYELTLEEGSSSSQVLMLVNGSHIILTWIEENLSYECSFTVKYSNGNVICQGSELNGSFLYEFDVDCVEMPVSAFDITAIANPVEGGIVSGGGEYDYGAECTLTAMANEGYIFTNWTKNDQEVSTNASYTFIVTKAATYLAHFSLDGYQITATTNPEGAGTITGADTYIYGATCTLTVTPNDGHTFVNWTKNGEEVSTNLSFSFTVTEDAAYVANFSVDSYQIEATTNPDGAGTITGAGQYEYGSTCTLTVTPNDGYTFINWTKDGEEVSTSPTYSFTVTEAAAYVAHFELQSFIITVSSNPNDGGTVIGGGTYNYGQTCTLSATESDGYTFINWTKGNEEVSTDTIYSFTVIENASYVANFFMNQGEVTQETDLGQGWNWWSTYVEQEGIDGLGILEEGLGDHGVTIRAQVGYTDFYSDYGWYGSLTSIDNVSSYKIKADAPCTVALTGNIAIPSQHPITLSHGWTWMGYVPLVAMDVNEALLGLEAMEGDRLKSQEGYSDYYPDYGWYGSLNTIEPGMGLMYYSTNGEAVTFSYPNNSRDGGLKANLTSENNHWKPNIHAYPDNMTVMAVVELDNEELKSNNFELAAFATNGECRGSVRLTFAEPLHRQVAFLTVSGEDAATLSFRLYNAETNEEYYAAKESLNFVANAIVGAANDLYVVHFKSATNMDEFANWVKVYPNPVNRGEQFIIGLSNDTTFPVRVEIINTLGVVETLRTTSHQTLTAPSVAGVYTLRITVEGKGTIVRKLVVK